MHIIKEVNEKLEKLRNALPNHAVVEMGGNPQQDAKPAEEMSNPENWRVGDIVECVDAASTRNRLDYFTDGMEYKLLEKDGSSSFRYEANDGKGHFADNICFRFVKRP